jgi:hypothetical protein
MMDRRRFLGTVVGLAVMPRVAVRAVEAASAREPMDVDRMIERMCAAQREGGSHRNVEMIAGPDEVGAIKLRFAEYRGVEFNTDHHALIIPNGGPEWE